MEHDSKTSLASVSTRSETNVQPPGKLRLPCSGPLLCSYDTWPPESHPFLHNDTLPGWALGSSGYTYREGNGTPLQCSCLENPMDGGAWWAAVHGVTTCCLYFSRRYVSGHKALCSPIPGNNSSPGGPPDGCAPPQSVDWGTERVTSHTNNSPHKYPLFPISSFNYFIPLRWVMDEGSRHWFLGHCLEV